VKLSMLRRWRAAIVASGGQIATISLSMLYQLSVLMSNICKKYVEDCFRDAASWRLLCVFDGEVKASTFPPNVRTPLCACLVGCICLIRLDTSFVFRVMLNQQTVCPDTYILSLYRPQTNNFLVGHQYPYRIRSWIRFRESGSLPKMSKLLMYTNVCIFY
jgi:hypothetical protein